MLPNLSQQIFLTECLQGCFLPQSMTKKFHQKKRAKVHQDANLSWTDSKVELLLRFMNAYSS